MIQLFQLEMRKRLYLRKYLSQTGNIFSGLYPHMNQTFGRKKKFSSQIPKHGSGCTVDMSLLKGQTLVENAKIQNSNATL